MQDSYNRSQPEEAGASRRLRFLAFDSIWASNDRRMIPDESGFDRIRAFSPSNRSAAEPGFDAGERDERLLVIPDFVPWHQIGKRLGPLLGATVSPASVPWERVLEDCAV